MMYQQEQAQYALPLPENSEELRRKKAQFFKNSEFRVAVACANYEAINYSLSTGAEINSRAPSGSSIIGLAIRKGHYDVASYLLSCGAAPNAAVELEGQCKGYTPLHSACRDKQWDFVELLLNVYRVEVNIPGNDGCLPIHYAVVKGNLEVVKMLLDYGANPNVEFSKKLFESFFLYKTWSDRYTNYSPLAHAICEENIPLIELLIQGKADVFCIYEKKAPLFYAIENKSYKVVEYLLEEIKKKVDLKQYLDNITMNGFQPVQFSVLKGHHLITIILLKAGANPNAEFRRVFYTKFLGYKSWTWKFGNTISLLTHALARKDADLITILKRFGAKENPANN